MPKDATVDMLNGFPPIIDDDTKIIILGSFPGVESLEKKEYYGNSRNSFWKILEIIMDTEFTSYQDKKDKLLANHIGIWDVIRSCKRSGSLDSDIRDMELNDFSILEKTKIELVCFNGKTSGRFERKFREMGFNTIILPSTSPANAIPFEKKLSAWKDALPVHRSFHR